MKKYYLLFLSSFFIMTAFGQVKIKKNQPKVKAYSIKNPDQETYLLAPPTLVTATKKSSSNSYGEEVGTTYYDLQTNGTMPSRVQMAPNGGITAIWTKGQSVTPSGAARRIGYNYYDPTTSLWIGEDTIGGAGIGSASRRGWPFLMTNEGPEDVIGSHSPNGRHYRPVAGSGSWQNDLLSNISDSVNSTNPYQTGWGGGAAATGDTIHHIAAAYIYPGDKLLAFKYSRSPDNTNTWDIQDRILPGMDSVIWGNTVGNNVYDAFSIDAYGNTVAIVCGGWDQDIHFWKSTDRGETWTHNIIFDFDTLFAFRATDGSHQHLNIDEGLALAVDYTGQAHIAGGMVGVISPAGQLGGGTTFLPFQSGMVYWNESMGFNHYLDDTLSNDQFILIEYVDENGDGVNSTPFTFDSVSRFFNHGLLAFPALSISENGEVVLSWSGVREDTKLLGIGLAPGDVTPGVAKIHRDIYSWASCDGGTTWIVDSIRNVADDIAGVGGGIGTPTEDDVFLQAQTRIGPDKTVRMLFQTDGKSDLSWDGTPNENSIVYYTFNVSEVGCISGLNDEIEKIQSWNAFPNPAKDQLNLVLDLKGSARYDVTLTNLLGQRMLSKSVDLNKGNKLIRLDISQVPKGVYLVSLNSLESSTSKKIIIE